ncbi:hypothetical protein QYF36_000121 [Acer negundo]|nr:hypothetical protein QYF36_000121 [Acer negundo]
MRTVVLNIYLYSSSAAISSFFRRKVIPPSLALNMHTGRGSKSFVGFKNFKRSRVWRTINDGNRNKIDSETPKLKPLKLREVAVDWRAPLPPMQNQNFKSQGLIWSDIIYVCNLLGEAPMLRIVSYYDKGDFSTCPVAGCSGILPCESKEGLCVQQHKRSSLRAPRLKTSQDLVAFDDGSVVFVTELDLNGYDSILVSKAVGTEIWADLSVVYRVGVVG